MEAISTTDIVETLRTSLLVLNHNLCVRSANRAFYRTFAVEPDATLGRSLFELGDGQWDIPALRTLLTEIIPRNEDVEAFEVEHMFPGIGRKVMLLNARKVYREGNGTQSVLLAIDDVTEMREAAEASERERLLAQSIVDTIRDPLVILEADMTVASASRAFLRLFGVTADAIIGHPLAELAQGQWRIGKLQDLLVRIVPDDDSFDGFEVEDEFPGLGRRIFKLNERKMHRPGNHVTRLLLVFEDVTEARLLERHRDLLAAELAHRIKNSLQIITSFVAFEMRRAAEPCLEGYRAMQTRIGAVAELYDVISRSASLGPVPVGPYLNGIAENLRTSLLGGSSGITVAVKAEPLMVGAEHAVTLGLVVNELATNAVKYAFPGGKGQLKITFARDGGGAALTISDDGVGLNTSASSNPSTSGLGQRFVGAFVGQLRGTLATATGEGGTTFSVRLPSSILADEPEAAV